MSNFVHQDGIHYLILNGVRRAKAAWENGHANILAEIFDRSGVSLGTCSIPLDSLVSPKNSIRRTTAADQLRWRRVEDGSREVQLPFPPIEIQPTKRRKPVLSEIDFENGDET